MIDYLQRFRLECSGKIIEEGTMDFTDATDQCGLSAAIRSICEIHGSFRLNAQVENALRDYQELTWRKFSERA
jgi:hypothetical protein